ncbi:MAG: XRE family transcriptional regulator [Rikenellaceae bacterium]
MNEHIKDIALRLRGLRDVLDLKISEVAEICCVTTEQYELYESGTTDIPVGMLYCISKRYNIEMSALLFGEEPHMCSYFLTRKGTGAAVQRRKAYEYQSLAAGFVKRKADPFLVTVEPSKAEAATFNSHEGQEFSLVLEGKMLINVDGKELTLEEGDSIYFDSTRPHLIKALDDKKMKMLTIII